MKCILRIVLLIVLTPIIGACVTGALNLREGIESFKAQDYRRAFIRLKPEAEKGQPDAQYAVGYMYYYGQGVVEDRKQAWFWITRAAQLGQPDALAAMKILEQGSIKKQQTFRAKQLQHYPVDKGMY